MGHINVMVRQQHWWPMYYRRHSLLVCTGIWLALFPCLPCFALRFELTEKARVFIMWALSGECEVDIGGGDAPLLILLVVNQFIVQLTWFEHFTASGDSRCCGQLRSIVFKLAVGPHPPYVHSTSFTWWMLPGLPCFHPSSASVYCQRKQKRKMGLGLGTRLGCNVWGILTQWKRYALSVCMLMTLVSLQTATVVLCHLAACRYWTTSTMSAIFSHTY